MGTKIAVLDRGFVYVGEITDEGENIRIKNARNIRYWGTTKGIGELRTGPTEKTKVDAVGEVVVPKRAVISYITVESGW